MTPRAPRVVARVAARAAAISWLGLAGCTPTLDLGDGAYPEQVVAGPRQTCVVHHDGHARCIGAAGDGQFGLDGAVLHTACGDDRCDGTPTVLPVDGVTSVALGDRFLCLVTRGQVRCAGHDAFGTLGRGTRDRDPHTSFLPVDLAGRVTEVVAGRVHACALRTDGTVACWGFAGDGALGLDPASALDCGPLDARDASRLERTEGDTARCVPTPTEVAGLDDAVGLRAGPFGTCARRRDGTFVCFGRNLDGSLGVGPTVSAVVSTPTPLARAAADVALGRVHGWLRTDDGHVYAFGRHTSGQLGLGSASPASCGGTPCAPTPTRVSELAGIVELAAGDDHGCALRADGSVACVGADDFGQLGDSSAAGDDCAGLPCARAPHDVVHEGAVRGLHAAGAHTVLLGEDALAYVFGGNAYRECGNGAGDTVPFPVQLYFNAF